MKKRTKFIVCILLFPLLLLFSACAVTGKGESTVTSKTTVIEDTVTSNADGSTAQTVQSTSAGMTTSGSSASTVKGETTKAIATTAAAVTTLPQPQNTVTLIVQCKEAADHIKEYNKTHHDNKYAAFDSIIPANGIMLEEKGIKIQNNDTALTVLKRVLSENHFLLKTNFVQTYVVSINGLAEKDKNYFGEQSGWLIYVNNVVPTDDAGHLLGASQYKVKSGDMIEFRYVLKYTIF